MCQPLAIPLLHGPEQATVRPGVRAGGAWRASAPRGRSSHRSSTSDPYHLEHSHHPAIKISAYHTASDAAASRAHGVYLREDGRGARGLFGSYS